MYDRLGSFGDNTNSWLQSIFFDSSTFTPGVSGWPVVDTPLGYTRTVYGSNADNADRYNRALIRKTSGGATVKDIVPMAAVGDDGSARVHREGWYHWLVSTSSYEIGTGDFRSCATGGLEERTEAYQQNDGHCDNGAFGRTWANPFKRGTLALNDDFHFSIVPLDDGSKRIDFDNTLINFNDKNDHPDPWNPCFQKHCPGVRGESGTSFWNGCDMVQTRQESVFEIDDSIELVVFWRTDTNEDADWPTANPHAVQFRDTTGLIL